MGRSKKKQREETPTASSTLPTGAVEKLDHVLFIARQLFIFRIIADWNFCGPKSIDLELDM